MKDLVIAQQRLFEEKGFVINRKYTVDVNGKQEYRFVEVVSIKDAVDLIVDLGDKYHFMIRILESTSIVI